MTKVQTKVASTILQKSSTVVLGGRKYRIAPPTIGTLILASERIADLPEYEIDNKDILGSVVFSAKDGRPICEICAILILGAKRVRQPWGRFLVGRLARRIENNASGKEVHTAVKESLVNLDIADFFAISTFLQGMNLTKPTKVETKVTASGQSSQALSKRSVRQ